MHFNTGSFVSVYFGFYVYLLLHFLLEFQVFYFISIYLSIDPHIEKEQAEIEANRLHMACEAFGDGTLPQLQFAVYKVPK